MLMRPCETHCQSGIADVAIKDLVRLCHSQHDVVNTGAAPTAPSLHAKAESFRVMVMGEVRTLPREICHGVVEVELEMRRAQASQ